MPRMVSNETTTQRTKTACGFITSCSRVLGIEGGCVHQLHCSYEPTSENSVYDEGRLILWIHTSRLSRCFNISVSDYRFRYFCYLYLQIMTVPEGPVASYGVGGNLMGFDELSPHVSTHLHIHVDIHILHHFYFYSSTDVPFSFVFQSIPLYPTSIHRTSSATISPKHLYARRYSLGIFSSFDCQSFQVDRTDGLSYRAHQKQHLHISSQQLYRYSLFSAFSLDFLLGICQALVMVLNLHSAFQNSVLSFLFSKIYLSWDLISLPMGCIKDKVRGFMTSSFLLGSIHP